MRAKHILTEITPPVVIKAYRYVNRYLRKGSHKTPSDIPGEPEKTHIFVACFPKSGSTYLTALLSEITGFPLMEAYWPNGHNEQDISLHKLKEVCRIDSVTQQHVKGTGNNIRLMQRHGIKPVVLVRNIFDVVFSIHDHMDRGKHRSPVGYIHEEYFHMTKDEKLLFLSHIFLPWYFNFFVSWREASQEMETLWVTYEELFSNQVDVIAKILQFYKLSSSVECIQTAINMMSSRETRLNVGISGRGDGLPDRQRAAIVNLARVWNLDETAMEVIGIYL